MLHKFIYAIFMILNGEVESLPEAAFHLVGTIDEAKEKGKKILAESR